MKKIIAILVAMSMVATIGLTCVLAAEPESLTVVCDVNKLSEADFEINFASLDAEENVGYSLSFTIDGIVNDDAPGGKLDDNQVGYTRGGSKGNYNFTGRSIDLVEISLESDIPNSNFKGAASGEEGEAKVITTGTILATTYDGLTIAKSGERMVPDSFGTGSFYYTDDPSDPLVIFYVAIPKGVTMNLTPKADIKINDWNAGTTIDASASYSNQTKSNLSFAVNYDGEASGSSVITLYEAAGGGGSTPVITEADDGYALENKYVKNTETPLTDLQGKPVELSKNYGIAKFSETIDTAAKDYFLHVVDDKEEEADLPINFAEQGFDFESATVSFFAIVRSATHKVVSMTLKAVAKSE